MPIHSSSPIDFNGLVRHYYLRRGAHLGDVRVNLVPKKDREQQSHELVLRLRNGLEEVGRRHGARSKIVDVPPGPPVNGATMVSCNSATAVRRRWASRSSAGKPKGGNDTARPRPPKQ